jgi:hypothetical protein
MKADISEASLRVIERVATEFDERIVKLGNELITSASKCGPAFTRGDITAALAGDKDVIERMRLRAVRREWILQNDRESIPLVIEWIRLLRSVTSD